MYILYIIYYIYYIYIYIYIYIYVIYTKCKKRQEFSLKPLKTIGGGVWFGGTLVRILGQNAFWRDLLEAVTRVPTRRFGNETDGRTKPRYRRRQAATRRCPRNRKEDHSQGQEE